MSDPYEQAARARRAPALQQFIDTFVEDFGIEQDFIDASAHPIYCKCDKCLEWWVYMGPEDEYAEELYFGPFSQEEVEAHCKVKGKSMWWRKDA